jgi:hypothetical protein
MRISAFSKVGSSASAALEKISPAAVQSNMCRKLNVVFTMILPTLELRRKPGAHGSRNPLSNRSMPF